MKKNVWVSVDLDFWCPSSWERRTKMSFDKFLKSIPDDIMAHLTIEHHEVLRPLRKAVKNNLLSIPFDIVHIDTHHDLYFNNERGKRIDCGNFMWSVPKKWYKLFKWHQPYYPEEHDWERVIDKLGNKVTSSKGELEIDWSKVGLITFTLSPDYCEGLISRAEKMIKAITEKFDLDKTIEKRDAKPNNNINSWGYVLRT